jgi:hypothetical protein
MTVAQLVEEFGIEAVSRSVRDSYSRPASWDEPISVVHAIEPDNRDALNPQRSPDMPWRSVYFEKGGSAADGVLAVRGYHRFPVLVWRYERIPQSAYGYGRGHDALPHLVRLRRMIVRFGEAVAKLVDPALTAPPGLAQHEIKSLPGNVTMLKAADQAVKALHNVDPRVLELRDEIERTRSEIRDILGQTLVASLRRIERQMTAREADLRTSQDLTEWLPQLHRQTKEFLNPYIEWLWDIALANDRLPEIPDELADQVIDIEFTSPLARKQDDAEVDAIVETMAIAGELAKVRPDVVDNFDFDAVVRRIAQIKGVNSVQIVARQVMQQMREARAQQAQAQAQAAAAQQGADIARTAAEAQRVA